MTDDDARAEAVKTYLDRHGVDALVTAVDYAHQYARGEVTHHIMAREQNIPPREAVIILEALRPAVAEEDTDKPGTAIHRAGRAVDAARHERLSSIADRSDHARAEEPDYSDSRWTDDDA